MVAIVVGCFAVVRPAKFLEGKGATVNDATVIWMREVGVHAVLGATLLYRALA